MAESGRWRSTRAEISLANLRHNCEQLRGLFSSGSFFCPMVKANAYGHGATAIAHELERQKVAHLGVALIEEGEELRERGLKADILVFAPIESIEAARALLSADLTPVVGDFRTLGLLEKIAPAQLSVHLEFNTGMNRFGFAPGDADQLEKILRKNSQWNLAGLCTHFQSGGDLADPAARSHRQLALFDAVVRQLRKPTTHVHVLNSSAALALRDRGGSCGFRPGISLYGADPTEAAESKLDLRPVLSWKTSVSVIHHIKIGESVSYDATWTATKSSTIGVLPVGYADGYARAKSKRSHVLCRGLRAPVVGTVCMDAMMVDLTDVELKTGASQGPIGLQEPVVLIGEQGGQTITASDLAVINETISYEVLTRIGERVPRVYNQL